MSNPNFTALLLVLDVSGSMGECIRDVNDNHVLDDKGSPIQVLTVMQRALHEMLEKQARKLAGYLTVDVAYFDDYYRAGVEDKDPLLLDLNLYAGGGTQIYDSTAAAVEHFRNRLSLLPENEKPGHVVVMVMTDGASSAPDTKKGENLSQTVEQLMDKENWDFALISATGRRNMDKVIELLGIPKENVVTNETSEEGISWMADQAGSFISMSRSGERAHFV
jgi:von Willebrand factor type A domain.